MEQEKNKLLSGNVWKQVLFFALPIAATSILQQLFNSTDTAVVGRFASSRALAAVGSTSPVANLYITILTGLAVGANVRIAYAIGAGDKEQVKKGVNTAMLMALAGGILLTIIGELFAKPMLHVMNTPADIIELSAAYLRIYFLGIVFLMIYNFEAAILRASGDSKTPLYCLLFSGVLNLGFNVLFVVVFHLGVVGVALGTLIADIFNAVFLFYFLVRGNALINFDIKELSFDGKTCRYILVVGVPAALQGMMFNISNLIVQTAVNGLGSDVVASTTIAVNAEIFIYYMLNAFGQAAVTFNGQNLGAGNIKRCRQATKAALVLDTVFVMTMAMGFWVFARPFASIFATEAAIIQIALLRMKLVLSFELANPFTEVLSGALRGLGHSTLPAVLTALSVCGLRILWVFLVFPKHHTYEWLIYIYPISWIVNAIFIITAYLFVVRGLMEKKKVYQG